MECTSADALNSSVSWESMDVPEYQPLTDRWPMISRIGSTEIGPAAPITIEHTVRRKPADDCCHCFGIRHGRDHNFRAAKLIQFRRRIGGLAVDVVVCAEFFGECFLVLSACNRHGVESHPCCELHAEMTESANPEHTDHIAASRAAVSQRVEGRYARAHQRRAVDGREFVRHKRQRFCRRNHVFGVAAIERNSRGEQGHSAGKKLAAPAVIAITAVATVPANADALASFPRLHPLAHAINDTNDFMSRHTRILNTWPKSFFD